MRISTFNILYRTEKKIVVMFKRLTNTSCALPDRTLIFSKSEVYLMTYSLAEVLTDAADFF